MGLVQERASFLRNPSEEGIKTSLFGFRVGQIIVQKDPGKSRQLASVFAIEYIAEDTQLPEITLTIMGLGYIYNMNFRGPHDKPEKWFEFTSGLSTTTGDPDDFRALTNQEMELVKAAIKKKPADFEDKKRWFDIRTGEVGKKILLKEDFQRGLSGRQIKDKLVGFRPGELFTYEKPWAKNKPFKEVYMFVKKAKEETLEGDGVPIIACYIGALSQRDGKLSQFLARNKKILGTVNLWQEEKRSLSEEEIEKVRKTFSEMPGYLEKITEETGLVPSLKESLQFKRGASSEREVKEKLLGWRPGQLLVVNDSSKALTDVGIKSFKRILVFAGISDKPFSEEWIIRVLEIGHISGEPNKKIVYIHFGFTEDIRLKKKEDLKIPSEDEIVAIQKSLVNPDYQKYVRKAEEKIGAHLFV